MIKKKLTDGVELVDVEYLIYLIKIGKFNMSLEEESVIWDLNDMCKGEHRFFLTQSEISFHWKKYSVRAEYFLVIEDRNPDRFITIEQGHSGTGNYNHWRFPKDNFKLAIKEGSLDYPPFGIEEWIVWKGDLKKCII